MILTCSDHWTYLANGEEYSTIGFDFVLVIHQGEMFDTEDALFGMDVREPFKKLKNGIAFQFNLDEENISLFWKGEQLLDEQSPEHLGMEPIVVKKEILEIHISSMIQILSV